MKLNLKNKTVLITGAGRGIGKDCCIKFLREGANVVAVTRKKNLEIKNIKYNNNMPIFIYNDLQKKNAIKKLVKILKLKKIYPDIIVNNIGGTLDFNDPILHIKYWNRVLHFNLNIAVELNYYFLPYMIKKNWGRICHVSSIAGLENQGPPSYCAAKAALNAYVRSVGRYVSKNNVIMTSIMPGAIFTKDGYWDIKKRKDPKGYNKYINERMAIKRIGKENEISELILILCSEISSFCAGTNLLVDGGQGRVFQNNY